MAVPVLAEAKSAEASSARNKDIHAISKRSPVKKSKGPAAEKKIPLKTQAKPSATKPKSELQAKAVYCENLQGNRTLLSRNPDKQLPVASLTKLVTALVILDHMPLNKRISVPKDIKKVPKSVIGLQPEDQVTVNDLLHGLLIGSGNDCAETLADGFPGGKAKFVEAMNKKARAIGALHTVFYTPSGLDHKFVSKNDGKTEVIVKPNVSTAREIARIAKYAFANKTIRSISLKKRYIITGARSHNGYAVRTTNKLLRENLPLEGGKTGFTALAGHCLASKFSPGRNSLLVVVLGSPDHFADTKIAYRKALEKANEAGRNEKQEVTQKAKASSSLPVQAKRRAPVVRINGERAHEGSGSPRS
ncbi:MAG: serine hydrolase [Pseudomonadota bacterium]